MKKPLKYLLQDTVDVLALLGALAFVVGLVWLLVVGVRGLVES